MHTLDRSEIARNVLGWIRDKNLDYRATSDAEIMYELEELGFTVEHKVTKTQEYFQVGIGDKKVSIWVSDWKDRFNAFKHGSIAFVLIDETKPHPRPEFRYKSSDKQVKTYDAEGNPKTKAEWYLVVGSRDEAEGWINMGAGYCVKNEDNLNARTVNDGNLVHQLCLVLGGEPGSYGGRGFAFSADIEEIGRIANAR